MLPENTYLICPCTGDVPFLVEGIEQANYHTASQEAYAIRWNSDINNFEWMPDIPDTWTELEVFTVLLADEDISGDDTPMYP